MKKWIARSVFILLAAGVISLGAVSVHFYQESRSYQEKLAGEYQANWGRLEDVTDLAASLYGENLVAYGDLDAPAVRLHVAMAVNNLYLPPHTVLEDSGSFRDFVRYYLYLVDDLDDPEYAADATPLFQDMNRDLRELCQEMTESYSENTADMTDPESDAYREAEVKIRAFMDEYKDPLSEYLGVEIS